MGGTIAKKLAKGLFVVGNAMPFDHRDKVAGSKARQSRFTKMRVCGKKILGLAIQVGELQRPPPEIRILFPSRPAFRAPQPAVRGFRLE